jgi:CRISPR-associated endonuclease/helicase Cas3
VSLDLSQFGEFFRELNTRCTDECVTPCPAHERPEPFAWQSAYVQQVAKAGVWPDLDVPTGLGKTSLIDIWTFLLAWEAAGGGSRQRTVPLRLFLVVDRRLIVDQAHDHGQRVARRLADSRRKSVEDLVHQALIRLVIEDNVSRLRTGDS